ncbi:aerotaxis receptor [Shigella sonnei]|nr:PAS domain-containing protein [Shigella sonnei]SRI62254.1 aerotaxis receptor [Shigella sonnei]
MRQNLPVTGRNLELPKDANILSTTSPQSHITYVNPDFIKISGFTEEELLGQPHNIVRHPDMPPAAFEHMWSTLKSGRSWMGLVKNRCKNGDHYWVRGLTLSGTKTHVKQRFLPLTPLLMVSDVLWSPVLPA